MTERINRKRRAGQLHVSRDPSRRKRTVSISHWAALAGLAEDGRSLATARSLIAQGDGPEVVPVRRPHRTDTGVQLGSHQRWLRKNQWAKFLATEAAKDRRK
jgi:hypothetical protein